MQTKKCQKLHSAQKGTTLVEIIVCFALLGIFMSAAAVVIASVTNIYYEVKGETYARQVSDMVLRKITFELEGAKFDEQDSSRESWPVIYPKAGANEQDRSGDTVKLYDATDTQIQMYAENGILKVKYFEINPDANPADADYEEKHYDEIEWTFDEKMYMGFKIKSLTFVQASQGILYPEKGTGHNVTLVDQTGYVDHYSYNPAYDYSKQGSDDYNASRDELLQEYPDDVVGVFLVLESPKYGEFYNYRYLKLYNYPEVDDYELLKRD